MNVNDRTKDIIQDHKDILKKVNYSWTTFSVTHIFFKSIVYVNENIRQNKGTVECCIISDHKDIYKRLIIHGLYSVLTLDVLIVVFFTCK